ncbi:MAG: hypothetical protein JNK93_06755 [Planctomycetia bacterium]|nr:hypothetical protein [Planctomycetia bacterium]
MKAIAVALAVAFTTPIFAGSSAAEIRRSSTCELETLFRCGVLACAPCGPTRGTVLHADGALPRLKARLQGTIWKGKTFHADGTFTNRWLGGITAGTHTVRIEPSWLDGQPCLVLQYPPDARAFPNARDEIRLIGPNTWLGHSYDSATGRTKNWFVLEGR